MATEREEKNKTLLMEKARFLFFSEGFSRMNMETISSKLGVSKATLYKYFPNKTSLLSAVIGLQIDDISRELDRVERDVAGFREKLVAFLGVIFDTIRPAMAVLMRDIAENAPWEWERILKFRRERVFPFLSSLLRQGEELGLIRKDVGNHTIAPLIVAMIEQFGRPEVLFDLPVSMEDAIKSFVRILFQGILSDSGREEFLRLGYAMAGAPPPAAEGSKGTSQI